MQVVPGNSLQNTVPGAAALHSGPTQPAAGQQVRVPSHAVQSAVKSQAVLNAARQVLQQHGNMPQQVQPNAPRGSVLDILV